jgi:hypothetical protein
MPDDMTHRRALRVKAPATLPTPTGPTSTPAIDSQQKSRCIESRGDTNIPWDRALAWMSRNAVRPTGEFWQCSSIVGYSSPY